MEIKGTIIKLLGIQSGQSANGNWRKQEFIVQTESAFPKKICLFVWGDKIEKFDLKEGEVITAFVDIESREYNGRWFTNIKAWKVDKAISNFPDPVELEGNIGNSECHREDTNILDDDESLPF